MPSYAINPQINNENGFNSILQNDIYKNVYYSPCVLTYRNKIKPLAEIINHNDFKVDLNTNYFAIKLDLKITLKNKRTNEIVKEIKRVSEGNSYLTNLQMQGINADATQDSEYVFGKDLNDDTYILEYQFYYAISLTGFQSSYRATITYIITTITNTQSLEKWTAWTVCERLLNIVEPLREDEQPRFKLDDTQKSWLESIETPELQITNSTLREALQVVGSYIHAEPRLIKQGNKYIITFDKYGIGDFSEFVNTYKNYGSLSNSINLENYATNLDSSIDNFVNSLGSDNGSIIEPFLNGYKSVLAEGSYVRITDENMYIETIYPIRNIKKLTCYTQGKELDITSFIFESAEYNQLSSYSNEYPTSKSNAIYYTLGQKGIYGLNFKRDAILSEYEDYAIINILKKCGANISSKVDYNSLAFQIEYTPIYPARVQQNKSIVSAGKKWTKSYNQGQNQIEVQYFGEHLKGVIARLGNVDKSITYVISNFPTIYPKVGELFDNNYYISTVATEIYPFYTKLTLALSQDFNRYSEYIGVNSVKRMYEVSEQQAFESEISYREFVVFGDIVNNEKLTLLQNGKEQIKEIFKPTVTPMRISGVMAQGIGYNNEDLSKVYLPVILSNLGNSLLISWKYDDNYSAGSYSEWAKIEEENASVVYGCWSQATPYADFYGRIKCLKLNYLVNPTIDSNEGKNYLLPPNNNTDWISGGGKLITTGGTYLEPNGNPILIEKGNTEIISFNYQLEFVTNRQDLIIGSGLAKNLNFVKNKNHSISLRLFKNRLNKFKNQDLLSGYEMTYPTELFLDNKFNPYIAYNDNGKNQTFKAWAFVDENGELLLGCNMNIEDGSELFENIYFNVVSEKDLYKEN